MTIVIQFMSYHICGEIDMQDQTPVIKTSDSFSSRSSENLVLSEADVHLWFSRLDLSSSSSRRLEAVLDADELNRAERFYSDLERERFIACRGMLRMILGRYLGVEPIALRFQYGLRGKPSLSERLGDSNIQFSLAHSGGWVIYGLTLDRNIGVDLERIAPFGELDQFVDRFYSVGEKAAVHASWGNDRYEVFFKIWTMKEAYLKACGEGLVRLKVNDVSFGQEKPRTVRLMGDGNTRENVCWSFMDLRPASDFAAAVVVEGSNCRYAYWYWPEI